MSEKGYQVGRGDPGNGDVEDLQHEELSSYPNSFRSFPRAGKLSWVHQCIVLYNCIYISVTISTFLVSLFFFFRQIWAKPA